MSSGSRGRPDRDSGPHLQVPRRRSMQRSATGISRLNAPSLSTQIAAAAAAVASSPDDVNQGRQGSSSRPLNDHRNKSYGSTSHSRGRRSTINSGEALDLATGGASLRRPAKLQSSLSSPHSGFTRTPGSRSFLLPTSSPGISGQGSGGLSPSSPGGVNKLANTMAPLSKPKRTSKTSQKLVVLPSGPQTKPLADDGEEASDDAALPSVVVNRPIRRPPTSRRQAPEQLRAKQERARTQEEEKPHDGEATKRVREYKSEAERMTKEERKRAGHKRITAYCVAEGLKMKHLTGFLKREHNVTPRVFDEAVYAVYQLPLLPGYGPNINVRSSTHPAPEASKPGKSHLLSTLQEAEENGYNDTYFPQPTLGLDDPPRLQRSHSSGHMVSESEAIPGEPIPGLVRAASVEEVRGGDGYMTSGSLPDGSIIPSHTERAYGAYGSFQPSYDPYPSSLESSPVTLREPHIPERYSEANAANVVLPTPFLKRAESSEEQALLSGPRSPGMDSGAETDDPGAFTDPGVYGPYAWDPKPNLSRNGATSIELSQSESDIVNSTRTEHASKAAQNLQADSSGSDVTTRGGAEQTSPILVETTSAISPGEESITSETFGPSSAYQQQLNHDREQGIAEDTEAEYAEQREKRRQLEYEHALEREQQRERERELDNIAEVVFFEYGVIVFFGLDERGERDVLEDITKAGGMKRLINEDEWEIEECHFTHDSQITYPRIYNDFFTLKSRSHLLKLSIAHALAQSTLLARYESLAGYTLSSPLALSIPRQMAESGSLQLRRNEALKLTGRLFKLRRDVNLVSNVLDVPELFWDEASLKELYDAVRDYMEIDPRVENLNEKLVVASDFLDAIHEHLNENAMEKITRIVIWLIVVAVLVEFGEIVARLVMHTALSNRPVPERSFGVLSNLASAFKRPTQLPAITYNQSLHDLTREQALDVLERMMGQGSH